MKNYSSQSSKMRKSISIVIFSLLAILLLVFIVGLVKLSPIVYEVLFNKKIELKNDNDRVNVLLLGIGGGTHDGPNLTDSIMFVSLSQKQNKVNLVTIPRDLWISSIRQRVNTVYAIGEARKRGGGIEQAKQVFSTVLNQPIDYVVRIDFAGFVKAVDLIGGLDINIERTFDDYEYPVEDKANDTCGHTDEEVTYLATASSQLEAFPCRYIDVHFEKGLEHMDGQTTLKFVRSRHAQGVEGTDFARSKRQEKVIEAFKNKILSVETLLNPVKVIALYNAITDNIDTDIPRSSIDDFIKLGQKMKGMKLQTFVLDYGDEQAKRPGLLINPPVSKDYNNAWVLIPRVGNGNFSEIQEYVACQIDIENCTVTPTP